MTNRHFPTEKLVAMQNERPNRYHLVRYKRARRKSAKVLAEINENLNIVDMFGTRFIRMFGLYWSTDAEKLLYFKKCNPKGMVLIASLRDFTVRVVNFEDEGKYFKNQTYGIDFGEAVWFDPATQRDMFSPHRQKPDNVYMVNEKEDLPL